MTHPHNWIDKVHLHDARRLTEIVPIESIDVTVTSPPYHDLKNYGDRRQIGYGQTYEKYLEDLQQVFTRVHECTKPTGALWIIVDTFKKSGSVVPFPFDLIHILTEDIGWILQDIVIWEKDKTLPWSGRGQLRKIFEYVLFFTKSFNYRFYIDKVKITDKSQFKQWWLRFPERYSPNGIAPTDIWRFPIPVQGSWSQNGLRHFNPLPPQLAERIILLSTRANDLVLDPFAGSGIALAIAKRLKRRFVGFEVNNEYVRMFRKIVLPQVAKNTVGFQTKKSFRENAYLRTTLRNMRLVKYPKALIRSIVSARILSEKDLNLNTVFILAKGVQEDVSREDKYMRPKIYFLRNAKSKIGRDMVYEAIRRTSDRPPLSKFGILPQFEVVSRGRFLASRRLPRRELYLYSKGVVHRHSGVMTVRQWRTFSGQSSWNTQGKNGVPPIVSDISVNQRR